MKLHEIRETRADKVAEMRALTEGEMTAEKKTRFDALKAAVVALDADEQRAQFLDDAERRMLGAAGSAERRDTANLESRVSVMNILRAGMEGRSLTGAEAEYAQETERRTGRKPQGVFLPMAALEKRVGTAANSGEIVPTDHRADLYISPLRNALLARRLGVRILSGLSGNVSIPKHGTGLTTGWVAENAALSDSTMAFDSVTLAPKHAGGMTEFSRQLIQQSSPDIEQLVRDELAAVIAQAIDSALILGGGANEPKGVLSTVGIQTASLGTPASLFTDVAKMVEKAELENVAAANWLVNPSGKRVLSTSTIVNGYPKFVFDGSRMADLPVFSTNQLPNKAGVPDTGRVILGDWSQVLLGIWSEIDLLVNPFEATAYARGSVKVRAMSTVDIAVRHPQAFVVADDLDI